MIPFINEYLHLLLGEDAQNSIIDNDNDSLSPNYLIYLTSKDYICMNTVSMQT